jgi:uncharacterized RDD family membrane protein YckC
VAPPPPPPKPQKVKPPKPAKPVAPIAPKRGTTPAPAEPAVAAPAVEADSPDPQHLPGTNGPLRLKAQPAEGEVEAELRPAPPVAAPGSEEKPDQAQQPLPQWTVRPTPTAEKPFPLPLASAGRRILARLLFLVGLVLMAGLGLAITVLGGKALSRDLTMQVMVIATLPAIYLLANAAMLARTGQDVGKRYAGVKVVGDDGTPATPGAALLKRDALTLLIGLTGVGMLYWLADLVTLFTPGGRCLHDRIAKTRVVRAS